MLWETGLCHLTMRTLTYFEIVNVGEEEEDEAEGHDPLAHCAGDVEGVVLRGVAQTLI